MLWSVLLITEIFWFTEMLESAGGNFTDPFSCAKKALFTKLLKKDKDIMSILEFEIQMTSQ